MILNWQHQYFFRFKLRGCNGGGCTLNTEKKELEIEIPKKIQDYNNYNQN